MKSVTFKVIGNPGPQGSKKFVGMSKPKPGETKGHAILVESSSKKVKSWREDVKRAAELIMSSRGLTQFDGPLRCRMIFTLPKPVSAPKRKRTYPSKKPDVGKLMRSTEDAMTDAGLWRDDARVVEYARLAKVYPGEDPEALEVPGVLIVVEEITNGLF